MSRRAVIFILWLLLPFCCFAQVDSTRLAELDKRLETYFQILEPENVDVKSRECDLLIDSAKDSLLRQHIALKAYDHYLNSTLMGDEGVAVHLTDTWFASGLVSMGGEEVLFNAKIFADFNRQSLLGKPAPSFAMESFEGDSVSFGGRSERYRVLLFYDTDCAKCKLELMRLRPLLDSRNWPVDLYAVYTGGDKESWGKWLSERMNINAPRTRIFNLWDPEVKSDYQMKYGVLQTPRMFLIDKEGTIIGRGLDSDALERLLDIVLPGFVDYEYGSVASAALMDDLFASYDESSSDSLSHRGSDSSRMHPDRSPSPSKRWPRQSDWLDRHTNQRCRDRNSSDWLPSPSERPAPTRILSMAKTLESSTLSKADTVSFKHLEGDLLYWLTSRRDELSKEGTLPFINEYILSRPGIWNTQDDTLKVVGLARMMKDLLSRTPVGSKLPKAKDLIPRISSAESLSNVPAQPDRTREQAEINNRDQAFDRSPEHTDINNRDQAFDRSPEQAAVSAKAYGNHTSIQPRNYANVSFLRDWTRKWNRLRGKGGYIVFHTEGCPVCKAELAAADSLGLRTLDVNVDEIMVSNPDLAKSLLDTFDLSSMPLILHVGRHGIILRRYLSFIP